MKPSRNSERFLILAFLAILFVIPIGQAVIEIRRGEWPQALALFHQRPTVSNLRAYEHDLEDASQAARWLRPWAQYAHFAWFKDGGDKALIGRDGWLFYKPGVQCLTQRPDARGGHAGAAEALAAIVSLRDQLAARHIRLLVVPAPNKESVYPEMLTRRAAGLHGVLGDDTRAVLDGLKSARVEVVDLFELFARAREGQRGQDARATEQTAAPLYLAQDSHWSPAGARLAAAAVAQHILRKDWLRLGDTEYEEKPAPIQRAGDILRMLQVQASSAISGLKRARAPRWRASSLMNSTATRPASRCSCWATVSCGSTNWTSPARRDSSRTWPRS